MKMKFEKYFLKGKYHISHGHVFRAKMYKLFCKVIFQCDIPFETCMDSDVYFCHNAFGVVINPLAKIGSGTTIQHSVTIGELDTNGVPVIGRNVFIGARAMVLGSIHIGNNVKIGAGAVVLHDVPDNCTVVGISAKIVKEVEI